LAWDLNTVGQRFAILDFAVGEHGGGGISIRGTMVCYVDGQFHKLIPLQHLSIWSEWKHRVQVMLIQQVAGPGTLKDATHVSIGDLGECKDAPSGHEVAAVAVVFDVADRFRQ